MPTISECGVCRRPRGARGEKTEAAGARTSALLLSLRKLASQCSLELTGLIGTTNTVSRFQMGQGCCLTERFQLANDDSRVLKPKKHHISRAPRTEHDGVLKHGGYARGGADVHAYRLHPAAVRNDARFAPRRPRSFRARRILFTSCQTARASAHRAVHLDGPDTKARACSW